MLSQIAFSALPCFIMKAFGLSLNSSLTTTEVCFSQFFLLDLFGYILLLLHAVFNKNVYSRDVVEMFLCCKIDDREDRMKTGFGGG